jgi:hypothetical protein
MKDDEEMLDMPLSISDKKPKERIKKEKHYQCLECKKKYTNWNKWMNNHIAKSGHRKFKKINERDFKW